MAQASETLLDIDPESIERNPNNPRRFFNDLSLDALRTSIQEIGILVPLIAYQSPTAPQSFVLMDGERRWTSALELGLPSVPVNVIPPPSPLDNLLRMFNIHALREDWPLISVALSLNDVMKISGETRESRLAEMTGLTRGTVRRAKRLLALPAGEKERISREAHLSREKQTHREDLYLEIQAAESLIRNRFPEIAKRHSRPEIIRAFAKKREEGTLRSVTEFRDISRLVASVDEGHITRRRAINALEKLIRDVSVTPRSLREMLGEQVFTQQAVNRRAALLAGNLRQVSEEVHLSRAFIRTLRQLRREIDRLLGS